MYNKADMIMNSSMSLEQKINKIEEFINGTREDVKIYGTSPNEVSEYIEKVLQGERLEIDCNGWQWDYWITYKIDDKLYMLSGSGYYGNMQFSKSEE
jgi:hypothetical protein